MTVSDLFDVPAGTEPVPATSGQAADTRPRVRARLAPTERDGNKSGRPSAATWIRARVDRVGDDWADAWLWDAEGITVRRLWEQRIPDRAVVPGESHGLWVAWCVYGHAALLVIVPLLLAAWLLSHPARLLYAVPVAAPLLTLWFI